MLLELRVGLQSRVQRIVHPFRAAVSCVRYRRSFFSFFLFCFGTKSTDWIRKLQCPGRGRSLKNEPEGPMKISEVPALLAASRLACLGFCLGFCLVWAV